MKLEINITKGKFWALATLLILVIAVFVFAATTVPNPGHAKENIEGLSQLFDDVEKLKSSPSLTAIDNGNFCFISNIADSCPDQFTKGRVCFDTEDEKNEDRFNGAVDYNAKIGSLTQRCTGQPDHGSIEMTLCCKS